MLPMWLKSPRRLTAIATGCETYAEPVTPTPRIGLVLGAGGVIGHAYHGGVLAALEEAAGWDPRQAQVIVGTSAGSVVGSLLRAGFAASDLAARSTGDPVSPEAVALARRARMGTTPVGIPSRPSRRRGLPRMASPALLARAALRPFWLNRPGVMLAGALPAGAVPTEVVAQTFRPLFGLDWPARDLWLTAVSLRDGRRVVFGRHGAPRAHVADAVAASCAIPGFFEPVAIGGVTYVDGGAHSPTNADLLADWKKDGDDLDLVIVSSPMSVAGNRLRPSLDLPARRMCRLYLGQEVARIRRRGVPVLAFQPTGDDLRAMGMNAMDPARRKPVTEQARESARKKLERDDVRELLGVLSAV
jgi:NTE family protein